MQSRSQANEAVELAGMWRVWPCGTICEMDLISPYMQGRAYSWSRSKSTYPSPTSRIFDTPCDADMNAVCPVTALFYILLPPNTMDATA